MKFPICERCGSSAWHCSVCVPAAPEREPLKGERFPMSEAELAASVALIAKVTLGAPSPGEQPCLLGLTEREWWHICTVLHRAAAERGPVAQPPEEMK